MHRRTSVEELKALNLLGVQFALCEASKYIFYLRYESGPIYKPATRNFELDLQPVDAAEARRLRASWTYWEGAVEDEESPAIAFEEELHPDHCLAP